MLFSEPKIPQYYEFSTSDDGDERVSVLFSEPKIPQCVVTAPPAASPEVSVLFSEPKIPQSGLRGGTGIAGSASFSALQRAENSSIGCVRLCDVGAGVFQCSSASRKFLNCRVRRGSKPRLTVSVLFSEPKIPQSDRPLRSAPRGEGFSALQRAENSSIWRGATGTLAQYEGFSALQRAENSSMNDVL